MIADICVFSLLLRHNGYLLVGPLPTRSRAELGKKFSFGRQNQHNSIHCALGSMDLARIIYSVPHEFHSYSF